MAKERIGFRGSLDGGDARNSLQQMDHSNIPTACVEGCRPRGLGQPWTSETTGKEATVVPGAVSTGGSKAQR